MILLIYKKNLILVNKFLIEILILKINGKINAAYKNYFKNSK